MCISGRNALACLSRNHQCVGDGTGVGTVAAPTEARPKAKEIGVFTSSSMRSDDIPSIFFDCDGNLLSFCLAAAERRLPIIGSRSPVSNKSGGALHDDGALIG